MEWHEVIPLPKRCLKCREEDCYSCAYAGERWQLSQEDELLLESKGKQRAGERLLKYLDKEGEGKL